MPARNVLIIMADEHAPSALGCAGMSVVQTPVLDRLAAAGTRFSRAYTPSPICVPARAAFQSGRYVHQTRCWSNAQPYAGVPAGWGHALRAAGHAVVSIGKLHHRSTEDDNGFDEELEALHVHHGIGWIQGLLRRSHHRFDTSSFATAIGPGDDPYTDYDRRVCHRAEQWLRRDGAARHDKPWVLFVSFLRPHYPLTCPPEFYRLYDPDRLPPSPVASRQVEYSHPVLAALRSMYDFDDHFDARTRQIARASYFGLVSFTDALVGRVLAALEDSGRAGETAVIYTSDHGEMNGEHGFWTKMVMYESAVGIPLILAGAGAPRGVAATQASLVDIHPTVLQAAAPTTNEPDPARPGRSLYDLATAPDPDRVVLSEYHDGGAITGLFSIRVGDWKYIHYADGFAPQLFDLARDPAEQVDLGLSDAHAGVRTTCLARLRTICDPDAASAACFSDQAARIADLGGEDAIVNGVTFDHTPVG